MNQIRAWASGSMIVTNEKAKKAILTALGDQEMVKILDSVMTNSKSVNVIIRETNIPYTTAYRKVKWLLNKNFLLMQMKSRANRLISQPMICRRGKGELSRYDIVGPAGFEPTTSGL